MSRAPSAQHIASHGADTLTPGSPHAFSPASPSGSSADVIAAAAAKDERHLTPRERMKLRKLRASEQRAAQLKQVQCTGVEKGLCVRGWGPL